MEGRKEGGNGSVLYIYSVLSAFITCMIPGDGGREEGVQEKGVEW